MVKGLAEMFGKWQQDCEDGEDDEELPDVSVGAGTPAGLPPAASLSGPFIADTGEQPSTPFPCASCLS